MFALFCIQKDTRPHQPWIRWCISHSCSHLRALSWPSLCQCAVRHHVDGKCTSTTFQSNSNTLIVNDIAGWQEPWPRAEQDSEMHPASHQTPRANGSTQSRGRGQQDGKARHFLSKAQQSQSTSIERELRQREREREIGRWMDGSMDGSMDGRRDGWIQRWIVHNNHGKFGHECVPAHSSQKCDFWQLRISSTWLPARLRWHPRFRLCPSAVSPPKAKSLVSLASFIESLISLVQPLVSVWQTLWQSLVSFLFVTSFLFVPQLWSCFKICKASGTKILRTFALRVWTLCTTKPTHKNYTVRFFLKVALSYIILYSLIVSTKLGFGPFAWADLKSTK